MNTKELIDKLQNSVREVTKCFLNEPFYDSNNLFQRMKQSIINVLRDREFEVKRLKFEIEKNVIPGHVNINPKNLYTVLAFNGINVPYDFIEGKREYTVQDDVPYFGGGAFVYDETGAYFKPRENIEYVTITISLENK